MLIAQLAKLAYEDTVKAYGREPTWDEFKTVISRRGDIRVHNTIASQYSQSTLISKNSVWIYGVVLPAVSLLVVPAVVIAWIFTTISAWWILASLVAAVVVMKLARKGQRTALVDAARRNEEAYTHLLRLGAFRFSPA